MDIYTTKPSTQYPTTMFYRTEDGVYDICKGCNMKIKVRGHTSSYPMKRHLDSRRHKDAVSRDVSRGVLNPYVTAGIEEPLCTEPVEGKTVFHTLALDDIRDLTPVAPVVGSEAKPDTLTIEKPVIPVLSGCEIRQMEENISNFYETGFGDIGYVAKNPETVYKYMTQFFNQEAVESCI